MSCASDSASGRYSSMDSLQRLTLAEVVSIVGSRKPPFALSVRNVDEARRHLHMMVQAEREIRGDTSSCLAGVDEAGRGPLAGPVVAASVILPPDLDEHFLDSLIGIDDSKRLTPERRESLFLTIASTAEEVSIGIATSTEIDQTDILRATHIAMRRAVSGLRRMPHLAVVDGNSDPELPCRTLCVVKGDSQVLSVAAASIVAKVVRDSIMESIHRMYPQYGFISNKGYPTQAHYRALANYGPCPVHRRTFRLFRDV